jgi:uncharacterized protein (TIGR03437 family)
MGAHTSSSPRRLGGDGAYERIDGDAGGAPWGLSSLFRGYLVRLYVLISVVCGLSFSAFGQMTGPALSIDAGANRRAISPDIYGINNHWDLGANTDPQHAALVALEADMRPGVRRWGGNATSTYNWQFDVQNIDADWFYEVLPDTTVDASKLPQSGSFDAFADYARQTGSKTLVTIPVLDWLPKARQEMCSYDVAKYGKQCKQDPYAQYHPYTCGNGIQYVPACGDPSVADGKTPPNPQYIQNDPNDAYAMFDESFQANWIRQVLSRYGKGNQGGVAIWALDNEPIWWDSTHRDIHPNPYTYDELLSRNLRYAKAIKQADPTALVSGPVADNYSSIWLSKTDIVAGQKAGDWFRNPVDRNAHGGTPLMAWYLQQFRNYEQTSGTRLLDYYETHAYLAPGTTPNARLDSVREWWDPTYVVHGDYWIRDPDNNGAAAAPQIIPRLRSVIDANYPGTKLAITEYAYGALDTLNGALAQADILGVFGREGVDLATIWDFPKPTVPGAFAFKIYRNYDGIGGAFGETSVQATSADQSQLSVYAALRADLNLTALVINKTANDLSTSLSLANFTPGASVQVWSYSNAKLDGIARQGDIAINGALSTVFPANSITMLVIPPATFPVPKPTVTAVTDAASYGSAIAPGQMVAVWGANMGPKKLDSVIVAGANQVVNTAMDNVRILFDGIPAPLVFVSDAQCAAVVPYFGAYKSTTHVQVEYQGVRSDPFAVPVAATAPVLFTVNATGKGPGAIRNSDGVTLNSTANPASPGSVVVIWGSGEGVTDPPGVDGRLAIDVLPKPVAPVTVEIGGLPATVIYAGAAPYSMPGLFQINAQMSSGVQPGDSVPVHVKIGNATSQDGVTLVVR